jgi:hypothetical protein
VVPTTRPAGPISRQESGSAGSAEKAGQGSKVDGPGAEDDADYPDEDDDAAYEENAKELQRLCDMCEGQGKVNAEPVAQASNEDGRVRTANTGA